MNRGILQKDNFKLFRQACEDGDLKTVKYLIKVADKLDSVSPQWTLARLIRSKHYEAFFTSHLTILKEIIEGKHICRVIIDYYEPFKNACKNGYLEIVKFFIEELKKTDSLFGEQNLLHEKLKKYNYAIFKETCGSGHLETLKLLVEEAEELYILKDMIQADNYFCFQLACNLHKRDVVYYLLGEAVLLDMNMEKEMLKIQKELPVV